MLLAKSVGQPCYFNMQCVHRWPFKFVTMIDAWSKPADSGLYFLNGTHNVDVRISITGPSGFFNFTDYFGLLRIY